MRAAIAHSVKLGLSVTGRAEPALSRYTVDQLAHTVVLDVSRAKAQGWTPRVRLEDYLSGLVAAGG